MSHDPRLDDQLAELGLRPGQLPTAEQYWELLEMVSDQYQRLASLRDAPVAHTGLYEELVSALDEAIASLAELSHHTPPNPEAVDATRRQWVSRLHDVLQLGRESGAAEALASASSIGRHLEDLFDGLGSALSAEAVGGELHREVAAATRLVLPERDWLETGTVSLAAACQPAGPSTGDFWLAHRLTEHRTLVVVGDVTGHGASSMVLAAGARAACALVASRQGATVRDFLEAMHKVVSDVGRGERIMTCALAVFDTARGELTIANAGHRLPIHVRSGGETSPVLARGAPLGSGPSVDVDSMRVPLAAGDAILLYTDGVVETEDDGGERYTERRLRGLLADHAGADPRIVRDRLLNDLATFRGRRPRTDDTTFVLVRVSSVTGAVSPPDGPPPQVASRRTS